MYFHSLWYRFWEKFDPHELCGKVYPSSGFCTKVVCRKPNGVLDGFSFKRMWGALERIRGNTKFNGVVKGQLKEFLSLSYLCWSTKTQVNLIQMATFEG